ncbi:hypothetical protein CYLTODRAFT_425345 [Cylindrobasidium torrendii FP15055 ss-10]|uniref:Uncharacterized protein n=1 Tax=Cylindrobasidium torrendii FP15055 ss-10 TaxID=1314674 RepID=A0A0D7B282_9AGAR|nr:hypothetical protein CYLTODRAFT_425345 [Cylindrobasidium torrendii FP15055 ss-10]
MMHAIRPDSVHRNYTKTPARQNENALRGAPRTIGGKGKTVLLQTPFNPRPAGSKHTLTDLKETGALPPLLDRTPFPNRTKPIHLFQTPGNDKGAGGSKEGGGKGEWSPEESVRPSSLRQHIRTPRPSLTNALQFQTPANNGNPWACNVSIDESMEVEGKEEEKEEDGDEVELCPPNCLDIPYAPPLDFVLPDYKQAGKTLRDMAHCPVWDDTPPPDPLILDERDMGYTPWDDLVRLPELEPSDPFEVIQREIERAQRAEEQKTTRARPGLGALRTRTAPSAQHSTATTATGTNGRSTAQRSTTTTYRRPATAMGANRAQANAAAPRRPVSVAATRPPVARTATNTSTGTTTGRVPLRRPASVATTRAPPVLRTASSFSRPTGAKTAGSFSRATVAKIGGSMSKATGGSVSRATGGAKAKKPAVDDGLILGVEASGVEEFRFDV